MPKYSNVNGVWKKESARYANVNGIWKQESEGFVNINGVWKSTKEQPIYTFSRSFGNLNKISYTNTDGHYLYAEGNGDDDTDYAYAEFVYNTAAGYSSYTFNSGDVIAVTVMTTGTNNGSCSLSLAYTTSGIIYSTHSIGFNTGGVWSTYTTTLTKSSTSSYIRMVIANSSYSGGTSLHIKSITVNGVPII